jgi:hypothetical protein
MMGCVHEKRHRDSQPKVKSQPHRFVDALRAGLQLKDQFPQGDIKVRAMQASGERTALH